MTAAAANRQIVDDAYASFFKGDLAGFLRNFDSDTEFVEADSLPYGGVHKGAAVQQALIGIGKAWTDITFEIAETVAGEQHVIAYGRFAATARATGRKVAFPIAEIWRIEDGRVKSLTTLYFDTVAALAALG